MYDDIVAAAARLDGVARRTPVLRSPGLDAEIGTRVLCKAESLQHTGSFKFRGAYNHVAQLADAARAQGFVCASSGNHAQALARTGRLLRCAVTAVVPHDCPEGKVDAMRVDGATVVRYDWRTDDRDRIVADIAHATGAHIVPSSDDYAIIAGAGTIGLELLTEADEADTLVVAVGGGGLAAGCATVNAERRPDVRVIGAEPLEGNDTQLSLQESRLVSIDAPETIADGLRHRHPSRKPLSINRDLLHDVLLVNDAAIAEAMRLAFVHLNLVIEPSGACALATLLSHPAVFRGRTVAVVLSGGNVDLPFFASQSVADR